MRVQHRQVFQIRERPLITRVLCGVESTSSLRPETCSLTNASERRSLQSSPRSAIDSLAIAARSPDNTVLNGSTLASSGCAFTTAGTRSRHRRPANNRMRHPERAVLVERGNPRFGRDELRARTVGRRLHELHDGLLGGPVVPRCKRIGSGVVCCAPVSVSHRRLEASQSRTSWLAALYGRARDFDGRTLRS